MAANLQIILGKVKRYDPGADFELLRRAHDYATAKHEGQLRKTGEPYIIHPVEVVDILAGLEMDTPSLCAGFLHDVIEDCGVTRDELVEAFGEEIASLVDGVTKLKLADFERKVAEDERLADAAKRAAERAAEREAEAQNDPRRRKRMEARSNAENLRKILLAMARDFRVMVIKLADRLHNMRTLQGLPEDRRKKVAEETMQIFAPLAHRLGIWQIKWQLEDLAFKHLYPDEYKDLTERIARSRRQREQDIHDVIGRLRDAFARVGLTPEIQGRPKHLWSIYNKMRKQELDLSDIFDLIAVRVITNTVPEAYAALGTVHQVFLPIQGKFDDYIAKRKSNLYQSLHTKVHGPHGEPLEVQIRTWEMHRTAEFGVAAHWAYKEQGEAARAGKDDFDRKMAFLRQQLADWQQDASDSSDFFSRVSSDLFTAQVFVFTPKGDVIDLPADATPIDFAFRIHSDLGEHLVGAKVNGKIVKLDYKFQNGDICAVITRPNAAPSLDWLTMAKSSHAKSKIKAYFRKQHYEENVAIGRQMLHEELARTGTPVDVLKDAKRMTVLAQTMNKAAADDLFAAIGFGDVPLGSVANKLRPEETADEDDAARIQRRIGSAAASKLAIAADGIDGVAITRAKCCLPLPGDEIIGYVSRGKGIVLHREGCPNVAQWRSHEPERLQAVDWQPDEKERFTTGVMVESVDRTGLLKDITEIFSENKTFILSINTFSHREQGTASLRIDFEASSTAQIAALSRKLEGLEDLLAVHRLGVGVEESHPPSRVP